MARTSPSFPDRSSPGQPPPPQPSPSRPEPPDPAQPPASDVDDLELRRRKIDESLTRLTAAHAGLGRKPAKPDVPQRGRRGRRWAFGRGVAVLAAVLVVLVSAVAWGTESWVDGKFRQVAALDPDSAAIQDAAAQQGDQNFLLVGSDARTGTQPGESVGNPTGGSGAGSDTIMVAHLPADRSRVVVVSFPHDLEVTRPACERWDPVSGNYTGPQLPAAPEVTLDSAFEFGGPRCITRIVQQLSGLAINHFVGVDFQGVKAMVDAVGGVGVCVAQPVRDSVLGTIVGRAGTTRLTGDQALSFVSAGHVLGDPTNDSGQIQRQQQFLSSLLRTALSGNVALDPPKLRNFLSAFASSTFGENVGLDALLPLAQSMQRLDASHVTFLTVPTVGVANERGNEVLRPAENLQMFTAIIDGQPLPGEAPGSTAAPVPRAPTPPAPGDGPLLPAQAVRMQVENGTSQPGAASALSHSLGRLGFAVVAVGNAPQPAAHTVIRYSADRSAQARTLGAAVPSATLQLDEANPGTVDLVVGSDYDGVVKPLPTPGTQAASALPENLPHINSGDVSCP